MSERSSALANGSKFYSTGRPCKHGHLAERYASNAKCIVCQTARNQLVGPKWRRENPDRVKQLNRNFHERNPGYSVRNRRKNWVGVYARRRADPNRWLGHNLRAAIAVQIRHGKGKKTSATVELLGCSIDEFRRRVEVQWLEGMSWQNWGRHKGCWHLDHKRPVSSFDLTDPAQQLQCFHFSNYQPLWAEDNLRKGARLDWAAP